MALRYESLFFRVLLSAECSSEWATLPALRCLNTSLSRSSALLCLVTSADHFFFGGIKIRLKSPADGTVRRTWQLQHRRTSFFVLVLPLALFLTFFAHLLLLFAFFAALARIDHGGIPGVFVAFILGLEIDVVFRNLREQGIRVFLFPQGLVEQVRGLMQLHGDNQLYQPAIGGDLVVLHLFGGDDERRVPGERAVFGLVDDLLYLAGDAFDGFAFFGFRLLAYRFEDPFEAPDMPPRLMEVVVKGFRKLVRCSGLDHPGQCLGDLVLGIVNVL